MDHALFFLFSFVEFAASLTLILSIFLFHFRGYRSHILFSAFMLTQTSYLFRIGIDLGGVSLLLQLLLIILLLRLMFQIQTFYAALMGGIGFIIFSLLQTFIAFITAALTPLTIDQILNNSPVYIGYIVQALTASISFLLSWFFSRNRIGFSFIPDSDKVKVRLTTENVTFLLLVSIAIITMVAIYYVFFDSISFYTLLIFILVQVAILVHLAIRKEKRYD